MVKVAGLSLGLLLGNQPEVEGGETHHYARIERAVLTEFDVFQRGKQVYY